MPESTRPRAIRPETWAYDPTAVDMHKQGWLLANAVLVGYKEVAKQDRARLIEDLMGFCQKMQSVSKPTDAPPCVALKLKNFNAMMGGRRSTSAADDDSESAYERRSSKKQIAEQIRDKVKELAGNVGGGGAAPFREKKR